MTKKYLLTGGPGTGKSTLLRELNQRGFCSVGESAEYVIRRELKKEKPIVPWTDLAGFQELVLDNQLQWEREIPKESLVAFLDRGIIDSIAYCKVGGIETPERFHWEQLNGRYDLVFIVEPLQHLENTKIRREDRETAVKIHETIRQTYKDLGYNPISIPESTVEQRLDLILKTIDQHKGGLA